MLDSHDRLDDVAGLLAALAHASRLHILMVVLVHGGAMSAGEIAGRFSHSWPTTSRHLRVLEQAGLLEFDKQGRTRVYRVNHERLRPVRDWLRWFEQPPEVTVAPASIQPELVLRQIASAYPEVVEELLEGKRIFKVRRRPFLLIQAGDYGLTISTRLPKTREMALEHLFVRPVQYRFGKADWITAAFGSDEEIPLELLWEWIDESYRAVAQRNELARLPAPPPAPRCGAGRSKLS